MTILFDAKDPLNRTIRLMLHRWKEHIIEEHKELIDQEEEVKKAIEDPDFIYIGSDKDIRFYYRIIDIEMEKYQGLYIRVVVRLDEEGGRVITAHLRDKPTGGDLEWIREKPAR